jgi:hypothetical protein
MDKTLIKEINQALKGGKCPCHRVIDLKCKNKQMPFSSYCYKHTLEFLEKCETNRVKNFIKKYNKFLKKGL